jgi:hypothetical protein
MNVLSVWRGDILVFMRLVSWIQGCFHRDTVAREIGDTGFQITDWICKAVGVGKQAEKSSEMCGHL